MGQAQLTASYSPPQAAVSSAVSATGRGCDRTFFAAAVEPTLLPGSGMSHVVAPLAGGQTATTAAEHAEQSASHTRRPSVSDANGDASRPAVANSSELRPHPPRSRRRARGHAATDIPHDFCDRPGCFEPLPVLAAARLVLRRSLRPGPTPGARSRTQVQGPPAEGRGTPLTRSSSGIRPTPGRTCGEHRARGVSGSR